MTQKNCTDSNKVKNQMHNKFVKEIKRLRFYLHCVSCNTCKVILLWLVITMSDLKYSVFNLFILLHFEDLPSDGNAQFFFILDTFALSIMRIIFFWPSQKKA